MASGAHDLCRLPRTLSRPGEYGVLESSASEHELQSTLVAVAEAMSSRLPELKLLHAIPNGGSRHPAVAGKLKAEGVKPGVPDLHLPVARGVYHSLYIEMKTVKGRLSDAQRRWRELLMGEGNAYVVCRSVTEGLVVLERYLALGRGDAMPDGWFRTGARPLVF